MRYTIAALVASLTAPAALADVPKVVTDVPPVHSLVAQVMGDLGAPVLLLDRGADAHDFQLRPSQAAAVSQAALVVWIGPGMTPWLDRTLEGTGTEGTVLTLLEAEGTHRQAFGAGGAAHDDHDEAAEGHEGEGRGEADGHAAAEAEGHDDHDDHGAYDPHAWLDPHNAEVWVNLVAAELARLDPENAATYAANAAAAAAGIEALEAELSARLAPLADRPFVTFHDAYGYFTGHFGLAHAGAIALGDAASPGAARLAELRAELRDGAALCVFPEANHDPRLSTQLAEATGTRLGPVLDPEGSALEPGPGLYPALMRGLADGLTACLGAEG
jgi:zinc transport system substrate-binding protein